jgi:putative heme-binding domain-containing protein
MDRPLDSATLKDFAVRARIEGGQFVFPGDRFEAIRPGYQVVYDQLAAPRHVHQILTTQLSTARRTLTLVTRPRDTAVNYVVTMPALIGAGVTKLTSNNADGKPKPPHVGSYRDEVDLLTTLNGVEAAWISTEGKEQHKLWLPHLDLQVAKELTVGSAEHEQFFAALAKPGSLTLRGQFDLWQMLQPAIQSGAAIDWVRSPENVRVRFASPAGLTVRMGAPNSGSASSSASGTRADLEIGAPGQTWQPFELKLPTGGDLSLTATWSIDEDPRPRAFQLRRFFQPWARQFSPDTFSVAVAERVIPELAGGNWLHGKRLFFSDTLACAKCHVIRGEGTHLGPELSNLIHRDHASVRKDLEFPNAAINPDHLASAIERTDGEVLTGIILGERDGVLRVANAAGLVEELRRSEVRSTQPATLSLMPEGLWAAMTEREQRDLMTFLLTNPIEPHPVMPEAQGQKLPPARKLAEVKAALPDSRITDHASRNSSQSLLTSASTKIKIVLCASEKDPGHGAPGFHDYPLWRERWAKLLALADGVTVETADRWPSPEQWQSADVVAFYHDNPAWVADKAADLDAFLARGGGLIFLHWSMNAYRDVDSLKQRLWRAWGPGAKFRYGLEQLTLAPHTLTAGLPGVVEFTDEAYWNLPGGEGEATVLATSVEDGQPTPQIWLREQGPGRVFVCIPGHFTWTFDDPLYRVLLLRGFAWAGRQPLDRFNELVTVGARFEP